MVNVARLRSATADTTEMFYLFWMRKESLVVFFFREFGRFFFKAFKYLYLNHID